MSTTTGSLETNIRDLDRPWIHPAVQALILKGHTYPVVEYIDCLGHKPDPETANQMLDHIAGVLRPVMFSNGYRLASLREFCPIDAKITSLVHHGNDKMVGTTTIFVRLRDATSDEDFLDMEDIIDSIIIELAKLSFPKPSQAREHQKLTRKLQSEFAVYNDRLEIRRYKRPDNKGTLVDGIKLGARGLFEKLFRIFG
ncbi:uncharacterized protein LAJ45_03151 [Morchella importuna]|uniref:WLM domain-containing protein n=1 Tax=Morchella conica CCBAS932 TaxID=1392247 RepID=A0A3N4KU95_9PEZI|nr:uncharacterized protein LAJ45_03151 [Morchella importuna]KAH8152925.1 hypothetical protein LAJ45_03151 [Morchella importuna]RPB12979.1 hypothetical protein P167DRAFT_573728 [Morchella conica CCBAS932]